MENNTTNRCSPTEKTGLEMFHNPSHPFKLMAYSPWTKFTDGFILVLVLNLKTVSHNYGQNQLYMSFVLAKACFVDAYFGQILAQRRL